MLFGFSNHITKVSIIQKIHMHIFQLLIFRVEKIYQLLNRFSLLYLFRVTTLFIDFFGLLMNWVFFFCSDSFFDKFNFTFFLFFSFKRHIALLTISNNIILLTSMEILRKGLSVASNNLFA